MVFIELSIVLLLILVNGLLAMSELAVVSSRRSRLEQMAGAGSRGARIARRLIDDPGRFLSTVQIGITLVGILAGAFSGATLADRLGDWLDTLPGVSPYGDRIAIGIVVVGITYLSLIVGELVPKRIALGNPERVAARMAPLMNWLSRLAKPAVWILRTSTDGVLDALGLKQARTTTVSEDEVKSLIAEGTRAGIFVPRERDMIESVLRLADRTVRVIMTPRTEVVWLEEKDDAEAILRKLRASPFSRFPVCRRGIDHPIGIVHAKDLARMSLGGEPVALASCVIRPLFVHDNIPVLNLLDLFQKEGVHMAIVVDEFGTTEGVATPTDILEAIAGDLSERGEAAGPALFRRKDGSWVVDGALPIDEFEDRVGLRALRDGGDFHTVAGFMLRRLGHLPEEGESFEFEGGRFEVVDMDGRRIDKLLYTPRLDDGDDDENWRA